MEDSGMMKIHVIKNTARFRYSLLIEKESFFFIRIEDRISGFYIDEDL